jgi:MGT family glycosyltransferase
LPEIVFCPKEFEIPADASLVPNRHYAEPSVYRGRPARSFPWEFLNPKRKLVYCSLGTQCCEFATAPDLLWVIIEAFGGLPEHQLVLASGGVDLCGGDERAPLPANVMVVTSAPQLELLERADLMITHGGLGSIKEAILAGVPVIVVPFVNDQPANGKRIEYHSLGRVLASAECSPEKIRQAVLDVGTNGLVRSCVHAMNATFRAYEQAAPAVNLIRASISTT